MPSWDNLTDPTYLSGAAEWLPGTNFEELAADYETARQWTYRDYGEGVEPSQSIFMMH